MGAAFLISACATPTTEPDIRVPGPDFGYIPNSIGIVPPGRTYLETAGEVQHGPASDQLAWSIPTLVRRGVAEDWELRLQTWLVQHQRDDRSETAGVGPVQLGFKHRISRGEDRPLAPAWGFEVELLLPVASAGLDSGKVEPAAWLSFDHTLSRTGTFTWNAGFFAPVRDDGDQGLQSYLAGAYTHFATPDLQLYGTGSWKYPASDGSSSLAEVGVGLYWYFSRSAVLVAGYDAGLTSATADGLGILGVSFAF